MVSFQFDGSEKGLFCCLFVSYTQKKHPDLVTDGVLQQRIGDETIGILTDDAAAERVKKGLARCRTKGIFSDVKTVLRSDEKLRFTTLFRYLRLALDNRETDVSENYADPAVLAVRDIVRRVRLETHRMLGFLRFSRSVEGFYYAHYEPDNDVTDLLLPHFVDRFRLQPFLIHDVKRNVLGVYDGKKTGVLHLGEQPVTVFLDRKEDDFLRLWRTYYDSVNIAERKNERLMNACMPKRYHKNLPEKNRVTE
ncbi:MAG: TIGR03915 family putative DNA repair protein [Candidatus Borkfalkiaceae bacterium]|nr:TIGR03915 family putative DNA repair protein [Christensenellaceae bacterium]